MTHNGLKIAGYTDQPDAKIAQVNAYKKMEETLLRTLDHLAQDPNVDKRWLVTGRTDLEKGFMSVNRAIFRPERLRFPTDEPGDG